MRDVIEHANLDNSTFGPYWDASLLTATVFVHSLLSFIHPVTETAQIPKIPPSTPSPSNSPHTIPTSPPHSLPPRQTPPFLSPFPHYHKSSQPSSPPLYSSFSSPSLLHCYSHLHPYKLRILSTLHSSQPLRLSLEVLAKSRGIS